ncbi:MAG: DUF4296 domain-containing protein [Fluviicola sp.]|nr:DUF4296 domain-containing protein [Fluviicola sp.]
MRYFWIIGCLVLLTACKGEVKLPEKPDDLIERDSMVMLLKDMTILESGIQNRYRNVTVFYKVMTQSGEHYLKSKNITTERFERSYDFYVSREKELQSMYSEIRDSLSREVNQLQNQTN